MKWGNSVSTIKHENAIYSIGKLSYCAENLAWLNIYSKSDNKIYRYLVDSDYLYYLEKFNFIIHHKIPCINQITINKNIYNYIPLYKILFNIPPWIDCYCQFKDHDAFNYRKSNLDILILSNNTELLEYKPKLVVDCPILFNIDNYEDDIISFPVSINSRVNKASHVLINYRFFNEIINHTWNLVYYEHCDIYYARTNINQKNIDMHRFICSLAYPDFNINDKNLVVDHINHNGLDNTLSNIRICNRMENNRNIIHYKSKYPNIRIDYNRYRVHLRINSHRYYIGLYNTLLEAVIIRNAAIKHYFGEFGILIGYDPNDEYYIKGKQWNKLENGVFTNFLNKENDPYRYYSSVNKVQEIVSTQFSSDAPIIHYVIQE